MLFFASGYLVCLAALGAHAYTSEPAPANDTVKVTIRNGTLLGTLDSAAQVHRFLGVPYAEPPVGALRLRQAVPLRKGFGERRAERFGPACWNSLGAGSPSEDCLTVNVWRPVVEGARREGEGEGEGGLPVLVWLYGGGLTAGYTVREGF